MKFDDWLHRQIEELGKALAALFGAADEDVAAEMDTRLEGLVGLKLSVLERLPPAASTRLITQRYGEFSTQRAYAALRLIDALVDREPARAAVLGPRRDALFAALHAQVGDKGIAELDHAVESSRT